MTRNNTEHIEVVPSQSEEVKGGVNEPLSPYTFEKSLNQSSKHETLEMPPAGRQAVSP